MKKLNKLCAIIIAVLGVQTLSAQEWTDITNGNRNTFTIQYANPTNADVFETWNGSGTGHAFDWNQTVTNIPDGVYELSANAMYRASKTYGTTTNCVLYATVGDYEYTTPIANFGDYTSKEDLGGIETQMKNNDAYKNKIGNIIVENGEAKIGIKSIGELAYCTNGYWFVCKKSTFSFKNVTDTYFIDLQNRINRMLASAVDGDAKVALNVALTTYNTATVENIKGLQVAIAEFMKTASTANPVDVTSYMANPSFEGTSTTYWYQDLGYTQNSNRDIKQPAGWNLMYSSAKVGNTQYQSFMPKTDGAKDGNCLYVRHRWGDVKAVEDLRQSIQELPAGKYQLVVSVKGGSSVTDANTLTLSSGSNTATTTISDFDKNNYKDYSVVVNKTAENATLDICYGLKQTSGIEQLYYIDDFRLYYLGEDLSIYKGVYDEARNGAIAARDNGDYVCITGLERTDLVNVINQTETVEETRDAYLAAAASLEASTNAFVDAKANYDALAAEKIIAAGLGLSEGSIASAAATTKTGLVALQDLKEAEYNYIQGTYTEEATLASWTEDFNSDLDGEGYKAGGPKYLDDWTANKTTRTTKQTVSLPAGDYALSVIARGQAGASGNLYYKIGDVTTGVALIMKGNRGRGVDVYGVANFSEEGEYNCNGEGFGWEYRFITFHLDTETQVEIGASVTIQGQWASVYAPVLLTTESSVKALRMTEITNLLGTVPTGKMNATVQSTLNEKKDAAEAASVEGNTIDELETITTELNDAIIAANASIAEYAKLEGYISMTKVFTDVTQYEQKYENGEFAADEVEIVRQELNVMRYNAASAVFTNKIEVTDWTGDLANGIRSDQHWSGNTQNYYDANSWTANFVGLKHTLSTTITLPNGTYVLKAAGRSSSDATLRLTIKNGDTELESVEYTGKGDTGYGIDTSGAANFSEEGEYANNDNGRGWEWEFAKFELDAETTVTLHVEVDYNNIQNRFGSFSDITLWMDDETYVAVNGGAINAPLAAAKALVDTKPMGGAENTALQNAITQAEGTISTPAELDGAIAALETAVANANAWIAKYNEAKVPLVAALERFEADYNNAENGALKHMNKDRWTTVLNMAQAAAVAKDVTDSYEGFATATENLVAALAAATTSINDYAKLDEAIKNAESISGANVGDKAFQRPQSAADKMGIANAHDVYKNATADGEGVTSVTTSLNEAVKAFKAEPLNAPADGQRFNIVMDYEGWEHHGKAATYLAGGRNDAGLYNIQYYAVPNANYAQAFTFTAVAGQPDCYTLSMTDVDNKERYVCTGTVYGGNANQIRTTTDSTKALAVKVIATATEGIHQLLNTEANNYIGGQDAGFFTVNSHTNFRLQEAEKATVTLKITDAGWATLILPFNAEIPEGVKAYTSVALDGKSVELVQVSEGGIKANTPYLIKGTGEYTFSGYGLADKSSYEDEKGLFVGTYVNYTTQGGEYVLQNHDGKVGFYIVGESFKPTVGAYRCYLTAPASEIKAFFFDDDDVTGINGVDAEDIEIEAIYTINGTKVNSLQKGLNIVKMSNGKVKKVMVP